MSIREQRNHPFRRKDRWYRQEAWLRRHADMALCGAHKSLETDVLLPPVSASGMRRQRWLTIDYLDDLGAASLALLRLPQKS